jgi:hypothetical protein
MIIAGDQVMTTKNVVKGNRTAESFKVIVVSKRFSITVDGVGRSIALTAIVSLTLLGALYLLGR